MSPNCAATAVSRADIGRDLAQTALPSGRSWLVHSSLRQVGKLIGGPATLAAALQEVIGPRGTIVVPTFTARNSTTSRAFRARTAAMTSEERAAEEGRIEGFDRHTTPAQDVGAFAEFIRRYPGAVRSDHPQTSFAALGPAAVELTRDHDLDCHLGERSPLAKLYDSHAYVLLVGVGFGVCTCFHLAEYRLAEPARQRRYRAYVMAGGRRVQREFCALDVVDSDFGSLGRAMMSEQFVHSGRIGQARVMWLPLRPAVDFAVTWMSRRRTLDAAGPRRGLP